MPKVSVIVPVYNVEKYFDRCVRSLFEQTLDDIEYIFVNDCTPDNSMVILQKIIEEYPNRKDAIHIINHEKNTGQSGARRDGMAIATGDYIIHCDADDWVELDMYENMYNKAVETNSDAVVCDMVMRYKDHSAYLRYINEFDDHRLMYDCLAPISVEYCSMCNRLISHKVFKKHVIEPFEGVNMWDDVGLTTRLRYYIDKTFVINKPYYNYNKQNELSTTNRDIISRVNEQVLCVKLLEDFFISESAANQYQKFIAYLKFFSKSDLLDFDKDKYWFTIFPENGKYLWKLKNTYLRFKIRLFLYCYCGMFGVYIYKGLRFLKRRVWLKIFYGSQKS